MTIQITKWSPDTCGCVIDYQWDDEESAETRKHWVHSVEKKCDVHKNTPHHEAHFDIVMEENQRKNRAHGHINNGESPIEWDWEGESPNRILHITRSDTNGKDKSQVQSVIDKEVTQRLGHGKVILH